VVATRWASTTMPSFEARASSNALCGRKAAEQPVRRRTTSTRRPHLGAA
jgi:hypothetical protein